MRTPLAADTAKWKEERVYTFPRDPRVHNNWKASIGTFEKKLRHLGRGQQYRHEPNDKDGFGDNDDDDLGRSLGGLHNKNPIVEQLDG